MWEISGMSGMSGYSLGSMRRRAQNLGVPNGRGKFGLLSTYTNLNTATPPMNLNEMNYSLRSYIAR